MLSTLLKFFSYLCRNICHNKPNKHLKSICKPFEDVPVSFMAIRETM